MQVARVRNRIAQVAPRKFPIHVLAVLLTVPGSFSRAEEIRVAVASNFRPALADIASSFEQTRGHGIDLIAGSTGKHYAQILNGAPFDIFLAADAARPARLESENRIVAGSRFTYALGRLALWSRDAGRVDAAGQVLRTGDYARLAIANPDLAPYGQAAREVLHALGLWEALRPRLVFGENIAQAFLFTHSGGAELGFVARSQLHEPGTGRGGSQWLVPDSLHAPIAQQAVLLRDGPVARDFIAFLRSPEAIKLIRDHGYETPP